MKQDYWNVTDEQVIEKTGKKIAEWVKILDTFKAAEKNPMMWWHIYRKNTMYPGTGPGRLPRIT